MLSRQTIEQSAATLLREVGVEDQLPVPLEQIAGVLGYKIAGFKPPEGNQEMAKISGLIDYASHMIYINVLESLTRQRFTLAHEIAHARLHSTSPIATVDFRTEMDNPTSETEIEANQFATALLMPQDAFVSKFSQLDGDLDLLSKVFVVSKQAVQLRIQTTMSFAA